ncbi:hypothetical protein QFZ20_000135 [Flavobacterium sp. W4I14]|nr:hypothetical protein [Flavobacterium sp. W4I14]
MKDIFIDNNVAKNFATPLDPNYKSLIKWLFHFDKEDVAKSPENKGNYAHLVVNQKLLNEYAGSSKGCLKGTAIPAIISKLTIDGRLIKKEKKEIEKFVQDNFSKRTYNNFNSNLEDHIHIPTVLMSVRRFVLTYDDNLIKDLKTFIKYNVTVESRPENLNYT